MLALIQSRMHIKRILVFVVIRHAPEEAEMFGRYFTGYDSPGFVQFGIGPRYQGPSRVLFEGPLASCYRSDPEVGGAIDEVEQHLLMISPQANDAFRIAAAKRQHLIDTTRRIETSVNQISEKNQSIRARFSRKHVEETG